MFIDPFFTLNIINIININITFTFFFPFFFLSLATSSF